MFKSMIALAAAATLLTACTSADESKKNNTQNEVNLSTSTVNQNNWSSLPEYKTLMKQVDKQDYTISTVTENTGKRVLLLKGDDHQYKSIFVKKTNRLKIIHTNGGGEIYNRVI